MNHTRITTFVLAVFLAGLIISSNCFAEELEFSPNAWAGAFHYDFKQSTLVDSFTGNIFPAIEFDENYLLYGLGFSASYDRYYLDIAYQRSEDKKSDFVLPSGVNAKFTSQREEASITLGMKIFEDQGFVYLGYRDGELFAKSNLDNTFSFKEHGFFIGANYGWVLFDTGFLSFNAAYADLDGRVKAGPGPLLPSRLLLDADAETRGLSYGISWAGNLSKNMGYSISYDINDYTFDSLKSNLTGSSISGKVEETYRIGKISIYYHF